MHFLITLSFMMPLNPENELLLSKFEQQCNIAMQTRVTILHNNISNCCIRQELATKSINNDTKSDVDK